MVQEGLLEPKFLGIIAFPNGSPSFDDWWEWVLLAIVGVSIVAGTLACLWYSYQTVRKLLTVRVPNSLRRRHADDYYLSRLPMTYTPYHDPFKNASTSSREVRTITARSTHFLPNPPHLASIWAGSAALLPTRRPRYFHNGKRSYSIIASLV